MYESMRMLTWNGGEQASTKITTCGEFTNNQIKQHLNKLKLF